MCISGFVPLVKLVFELLLNINADLGLETGNQDLLELFHYVPGHFVKI